jgi:hypothetical protein
VRGPEVRFVRLRDAQHLLDREAFPTGAAARMYQRRVEVADAEQRVQQPGCGADFLEVEAADLDHLDAAEQRLTGLPQQGGQAPVVRVLRQLDLA